MYGLSRRQNQVFEILPREQAEQPEQRVALEEVGEPIGIDPAPHGSQQPEDDEQAKDDQDPAPGYPARPRRSEDSNTG